MAKCGRSFSTFRNSLFLFHPRRRYSAYCRLRRRRANQQLIVVARNPQCMTQTENTMSNSNNNGEGATPLHFCPIDQNLLHVTNTPYPDPNSMPAHMAEQEQRYTRHGQRLYRWYCLTCNYTYPINTAVRIEVELTPKEVDDVLGGEGAWKYAAVEKNVHCEREGCTNKGTFFCGRRSSFVVRRSSFVVHGSPDRSITCTPSPVSGLARLDSRLGLTHSRDVCWRRCVFQGGADAFGGRGGDAVLQVHGVPSSVGAPRVMVVVCW